VDAGLICQARSSITVAMYTFTGPNLAYALAGQPGGAFEHAVQELIG
jgi:hypothetical protein